MCLSIRNIFYDDIAASLKAQFGIETDGGRYHASHSPNIFLRKKGFDKDANNIIMRIAWAATLWDSRRLAIARDIAAAINRDILGLPGNPANPDLTLKKIGF